MTVVSCAVEGDLDAVLARRLLAHLDHEAGPIHGLSGKPHLRKNISGYAAAARHNPWFVLVDLDDEEPCGGALVSQWVPERPEQLFLRVAVREAEAWLLADRHGFSRFLSVSGSLIPRDVDSLDDPKGTVLQLARRSRLRAIREGLPPRPGSARKIGPLYVSEVSRFVQDNWDVDEAAAASPSLARCLLALGRLD